MTDDPASETDLTMMRRALELADKASAMSETPVGAVVYETATGAVLGEGHNRRQTDRDPSAHAEHIAVCTAARAIGDWRLNSCTLCVTLEPCPMCAGLIVNARLGRVVFGAADPKAGAVRTLFTILEDDRLNHRCEVIPGVMAQESAERLRVFFRSLRASAGDGPGSA